MKPKFAASRIGNRLPVSMFLSMTVIASSSLMAAEPPTIDPEITITAPSSIRAVAGTTLQPLNFTATNLIAGSGTAFGLALSEGSVGSINSLRQPDATVIPGGIRITNPPFTNVSLLAGNTGTISATPNIAGVLAGNTATFGLTATKDTWNSSVTANASINVVSNRLLTGSATINAGRHIAGLQTIGTITLSGGALTGTEGTNISIHSGGNAQLSNGLRLTSATDFTFNGADQTHNLQISYNRPTGAYNITGAALPANNTYTDASGNQHQEFGGAWKTSAEYGNVLGAKRIFTEETRPAWDDLPGNDRAWQRPSTNGNSSVDYIYNQEIATTAQPTIPTTRNLQVGSLNTAWELARGAGTLINERINPLISGEIIQGSSLNLSGVSFNITGTAVTDRSIYGGTVDLGRRMMGSANQIINRNDTVTLSTFGADDHQTRLSLAEFDLSGSGVTAAHSGTSAFTNGSHTASVQLSGNFTIDTSVAGYVTRQINAGSSIAGEGLVGENKQSTLNLGYTWNNVQNNSLVVDNLLIIDSNTRSDSRTYGTSVYTLHGTDTHTSIGASGGNVNVSGSIATGLNNLGNRTVTPIAEGLAGEVLTGSVSFNTNYASVADAAFTVTHNGSPGSTLTDGNTITLRDTGSGIYQNNLAISGVSISGGQNLEYQLVYGGGDALLQHGTSRTLTVDYTGNTSIPAAGQLGRISRADLNISLRDQVNYSDIVSAAGSGRSVSYNTNGGDLGTRTFALETRFNAPASAEASSSVSAGTDFGVNGLTLGNTVANTSARFTETSSLELLDSQALNSSTTVQVEFIALDDADPAVVAALETQGANAASLAGIYGGGSIFASEIVELTGLNGVRQVLQLGYDLQGLDEESGAQIIWRYNFTDGNAPQVAWINSVLGNSNISLLDFDAGTLSVSGNSDTIEDYLTATRYEGSYDAYLAENALSDPALGAWGVDYDSNKVWAVIDHNSSFAVVIPEPSAFLLTLVAGGGLLLRRRRDGTAS